MIPMFTEEARSNGLGPPKPAKPWLHSLIPRKADRKPYEDTDTPLDATIIPPSRHFLMRFDPIDLQHLPRSGRIRSLVPGSA